MAKNKKAGLVRAAMKARQFAHVPYSGFPVGAALLAAGGKVTGGANVESASFGLTCCAERVALFKALTSGGKTFSAIAIVARVDGGPMPCGACRQLLVEHAPDALVWVADSQRPLEAREFTVRELLPGAFLAFKGKRPEPD